MRKKARGRVTHIHVLGLILVGAVSLGAFTMGYGVDTSSQVAFGAAADAKCTAGNYEHDYRKKTKPCKPEGTEKCMKNFPCADPDGKVKGHCEKFNKCKGDSIDGKAPMLPMMGMMMPMMGGMPPMLPMIPMGMPSMDMPMQMMPNYCPPKKDSPTATTTATTTDKTASTSSSVMVQPGHDPNCIEDPYSQAYSQAYSWGNNFRAETDSGSSNNTSSGDDSGGTGSGSVWARLMSSLGLDGGGGEDDTRTEQEEFTYHATGTGRVTAEEHEAERRASTTDRGRYVGSQTFVTFDLSDQLDTGSETAYHGAAETFVDGTALILANIKAALVRLLAILMALINNR